MTRFELFKVKSENKGIENIKLYSMQLHDHLIAKLDEMVMEGKISELDAKRTRMEFNNRYDSTLSQVEALKSRLASIIKSLEESVRHMLENVNRVKSEKKDAITDAQSKLREPKT